MQKDKIEAIVSAPELKNLQELCSFHGLLNYNGNFMPGLSTNVHQLNSLLQCRGQLSAHTHSSKPNKSSLRLVSWSTMTPLYRSLSPEMPPHMVLVLSSHMYCQTVVKTPSRLLHAHFQPVNTTMHRSRKRHYHSSLG